MNEQNQTQQLGVIDQIERAQIDMQIATAKRYPRPALSQIKSEMLSYATLDEETAAGCFYSLPRAGKTIKGPSVRMAEIAVSCFCNIRTGARVISIDSGGDNPNCIIQAVAHDLEKNVAVSIEKRRRITGKVIWENGKKVGNQPPDDDAINLAVNSCTAIAFRDAVFKVVPLALIKPVCEAAMKVAIGDVKSLVEKRGKVVDRLKQMGVTEDRILAVVMCHKIEDIGLEQLEALIGLGTAIKDGQTSIEDAFPPPKPRTEPTFSDPTGAGQDATPVEAPKRNLTPEGREAIRLAQQRRREKERQAANGDQIPGAEMHTPKRETQQPQDQPGPGTPEREPDASEFQGTGSRVTLPAATVDAGGQTPAAEPPGHQAPGGPVLTDGQQLLNDVWDIIIHQNPGADFDDLKTYGALSSGHRDIDWDAVATIADIPDDVARSLAQQPQNMANVVRACIAKRAK